MTPLQKWSNSRLAFHLNKEGRWVLTEEHSQSFSECAAKLCCTGDFWSFQCNFWQILCDLKDSDRNSPHCRRGSACTVLDFVWPFPGKQSNSSQPTSSISWFFRLASLPSQGQILSVGSVCDILEFPFSPPLFSTDETTNKSGESGCRGTLNWLTWFVGRTTKKTAVFLINFALRLTHPSPVTHTQPHTH